MDDLSDILFKNILDKRLLLTKKIVLTEKFFDIFIECGILNLSINKDTVCKLKSQDIRLDELLKCLLLTSHTYPNEINVDTITKIYVLLKISLEEDKNLFVITEEQKMKANEISPENKKEIEYLCSSSDEKCLLNFARYCGYTFVDRGVDNTITIEKVVDQTKIYRINYNISNILY